jgi:hypothetical protein
MITERRNGKKRHHRCASFLFFNTDGCIRRITRCRRFSEFRLLLQSVASLQPRDHRCRTMRRFPSSCGQCLLPSHLLRLRPLSRSLLPFTRVVVFAGPLSPRHSCSCSCLFCVCVCRAVSSSFCTKECAEFSVAPPSPSPSLIPARPFDQRIVIIVISLNGTQKPTHRGRRQLV